MGGDGAVRSTIASPLLAGSGPPPAAAAALAFAKKPSSGLWRPRAPADLRAAFFGPAAAAGASVAPLLPLASGGRPRHDSACCWMALVWKERPQSGHSTKPEPVRRILSARERRRHHGGQCRAQGHAAKFCAKSKGRHSWSH